MPNHRELKDIVINGGGLILDVSKFTINVLKEIATEAAKNNAFVVCKNISKLTTTNMKEIAMKSKGHVIFNFCS
jgi:hypothetical protein